MTNTADSISGTLRQAVLDANANPGADTIEFSIPGNGPYHITLHAGEIEIAGELLIKGNALSEERITVSANDNSRVFSITDSGAGGVVINHLTIADGNSDFGGGIDVRGEEINLRLGNCTITNCNTTSGGGGLAFDSSGGELRLEQCTISDNDSGGWGGGVLIDKFEAVEVRGAEYRETSPRYLVEGYALADRSESGSVVHQLDVLW